MSQAPCFVGVHPNIQPSFIWSQLCSVCLPALLLIMSVILSVLISPQNLLVWKCLCPPAGGGGYLNTSVVHMHDNVFSKHTLIEICPFEENTPKQRFQFRTQFYPPKQDSLGIMFCGIEEFDKWPLHSYKRIHKGPFFLKTHFDPQLWFLWIAFGLKKHPYFLFLLVSHVYNTSIWVPSLLPPSPPVLWRDAMHPTYLQISKIHRLRQELLSIPFSDSSGNLIEV